MDTDQQTVERFSTDERRGMARSWINAQIEILNQQLGMPISEDTREALSQQLGQWQSRLDLMHLGKVSDSMDVVDVTRVRRAQKTLGLPEDGDIAQRDVDDWAQSYLDRSSSLS